MNKLIVILTLLAAACLASAQTTNTFTGTLYVSPKWTHTVSSTVSRASATESIERILEQPHATGTNDNQMNAFVWAAGTLTNGQAVVVNLAAATNRFGQVVNFARINFIGIQAATNNADNLVVGDVAAALPLFGDTNQTAIIRPGGLMLATSPRAASTNDGPGYVSASKFIRVANTNASTNTVSLVYEVYLGGQQ